MRPNVFRSATWKQARGRSRMVAGICLIAIISRFAAEEITRIWPSWALAIYGILVLNALFLSCAWVKRVRKAIEEGEFD